MGCFPDNLRAFGINPDQWTTAVQDEGECRKTAEQGAESFMAKLIAAEKVRAGPRHAVVCPNVTGRAKDRIAQIKRVRAGSFAMFDYPLVVRTCILRVFGLQMSCCVSLVLRLICFLFSFRFHVCLYALIETAAVRSIILRHACTRTATSGHLKSICALFFCFFFVSLEMLLFLSIFWYCCRFFSVWRVRSTLFPSGWCFPTL